MRLSSLFALTPESAREQIRVLSEFQDGIFRPDMCDVYEPIREVFNPQEIDEPVRWLSRPGGWFQFKKRKPIRVEGFIRNHRFQQTWISESRGAPLVEVAPKISEPKFLTSWSVRIDRKAVEKCGVGVLKRFLCEMFVASKSEYGYMTTETDYKSKHFSAVRTESPVTNGEYIVTERYIGCDPADGVPGLYWINIFGAQYSKWIQLGMHSIPATVEKVGEGVTLVQYGLSPDECESVEVRERQRTTISVLGQSKFFNIESPNREVESPFR